MVLKKVVSILSLVSPITTVTAAFQLPLSNHDDRVPGAYIIEFAEPQFTAQDFYSNYTALRRGGIKPRTTYSRKGFFYGCSFTLSNDVPQNLETIFSMEMVKAIWPITKMKLDRPVKTQTFNPKARQVSSSKLGKRAIDLTKDTYSPHVQTAVNKLRAEGLDGTGIKVAIFDSGIDYNHPAFGGGFGPGFTFTFGRDVVGNKFNGENALVESPDPMDCDGHGTHVGGILSAIDEKYGFTGVAPKAEFGMFKVFGCPDGKSSGDTNDEAIIKAFEYAMNANVNLISISIGKHVGWSEGAAAVMLQRVVDAGFPVVISAGNFGDKGQFYANDYADAIGSISVASLQNSKLPIIANQGSYTMGDTVASFAFLNANKEMEAKNAAFTLVAGNPLAGCTPLTNGATQLNSGTAILIDISGGCDIVSKAVNAVNAVPGQLPGALVFISDDQAITVPQMIDIGFPAVVIDRTTGTAFYNAITQGITVTINFPATEVQTVKTYNNPFANTPDVFTTWGPTFELHGRPHISAPGGNILSTYLVKKGGYSVQSGTSMSAPYTAGVIALLLQSYKNQGKAFPSPAEIRNMITTNGVPQNFFDGGQRLTIKAPVVQQGGGLLNSYGMVKSTISVNTDLLQCNDTVRHNGTQKFIITNKGDNAATYTVTRETCATSYTYNSELDKVQEFPPTLDTTGAVLTVTPATFSLDPGASQEVTVKIVQPKVSPDRLPVYGGWVKVAVTNPTGGSVIRVPYMGAIGNMTSQTQSNIDLGYPLLLDSKKKKFIKTAENGYTFTGSIPSILTSLKMGSAKVLLEIVNLSDKSKNTIHSFGIDVQGSVAGFPKLYNPRVIQYRSYDWNKTYVDGDGNVVTIGDDDTSMYKLIYRVLKLYGNQNRPWGWQRWDSPLFHLNAQNTTS